MAKDSTTDDVRAHLNDVQIAGISDVIRLSSEGSNSSSFCVTVDNQLAEIAVFQTEKWPRGIRIRPYIRRKDQHGSRNGNVMRNTRNQNNRANFNHRAYNSHFRGYHGRSGYPLTQRNQAGSNRRYSSNNDSRQWQHVDRRHDNDDFSVRNRYGEEDVPSTWWSSVLSYGVVILTLN